MTKQELTTKVYFLDSDDKKTLVDPDRIIFEFKDGARVSVELATKLAEKVAAKNGHKFVPRNNEIGLRGYYGDEDEYGPSCTKYFVFNVRPGACNLARISNEIYDRTDIEITASKDTNDKQSSDVDEIYMIDATGKHLVNPDKILFEFADGAKVLMELTDKFSKKFNIASNNEISLSGYCGNSLQEQTDSVIFNIIPGACNVLHISNQTKKFRPCNKGVDKECT